MSLAINYKTISKKKKNFLVKIIEYIRMVEL